MSKRKGLSKKVRFEVFKRDSFKCAYCGKSPPAVTLEVDHIVPVADGGENDMSNLITSCHDCNSGKGAVPLSRVPQQLSDNFAELKEHEDQIREYRKFIKGVNRRAAKDVADISAIFSETFTDKDLSQKFKKVSLKKFLELLPKHEVEDAMEIATSVRPDDPENAVKYFCGVCWKKIKANGEWK
ncbi:MAG: HNH endonuclease [Clostridiales bacterium]|nr:HNH endonuclease [Clostridiales bacterium]